MRQGDHGADDLLIARVCGIVAHHAERPAADVDIPAAVAAVHAITTDPHLLGHAWMWPSPHAVFADPWADIKNRILGEAGADPQHPHHDAGC